MLYSLLKLPARIAFLFYCRSIIINNKNALNLKGPLLIAANHPNSFLDAIIIATLFKQPVWSLTRGDVYKNDLYTRILTSLNMLPVYRISEGAENLNENYSTFDKCREIFKKNGIVLIFSEGGCVNEWKLRPLKKGTARLAISSWEAGIDLKILPVGINYQSFTSFGKNIRIRFGDLIGKDNMNVSTGFGRTITDFNIKLSNSLSPLVIRVEDKNKAQLRREFYVRLNPVILTALMVPAIIGWITHALLYLPVKKYTWKVAGHTGHYDSIMIAILFAAYPVYLILLCLLVSAITPGIWWLCVLLLPFCAWSLLQIKKQF